MNREEALVTLLLNATGEVAHSYFGDCPDGGDHYTRDGRCVVCQAIMFLEKSNDETRNQGAA